MVRCSPLLKDFDSHAVNPSHAILGVLRAIVSRFSLYVSFFILTATTPLPLFHCYVGFPVVLD